MFSIAYAYHPLEADAELVEGRLQLAPYPSDAQAKP
jgi:hypothetical protein